MDFEVLKEDLKQTRNNKRALNDELLRDKRNLIDQVIRKVKLLK